MYYRYEIIDKNKNKHGLLSGLEEIGLSERRIDELMEPFDKYLPVPNFYYVKGKNGKKNIFAYFTEFGNEKFKKYIEIIEKEIKTLDCFINIIKQPSVGSKRLVYEDKYQVLIKKK